jgi:hypothetical protein
MRFEASMILEEQIKLLASELERTRSELRALQRQHRQVNLAKRMTYLAGFVVLALMIGGTLAPRSIAQQEVPRPTTILEAPVEIRGKSGQTIVKIDDDKGTYGLHVYSPNVPSSTNSPNGPSSPGASVHLGFEGGGTSGLILLKEGPNFTAKLGRDGLRLYKTNQAVAYLGISPGGNGELQLGNPAGASLVEAGALDSNTGVVRVYPFGATPIPIPTFLRGMKKQ